MGCECEKAWPLLAAMLLSSCGGGGEAALSATQEKTQGAAFHPGTNRVVIRYDRDGDTHPDVLTLDAACNPLVIVEAIRGTADGAGTDATDAWRGGEIGADLNDALQIYLTESCSVGSKTNLEVILDGKAVNVTVIE